MHVRERLDDFWDCLLDTTDAECVAVLTCHVDASIRKDSGLLSVAGYLFESGRVRRFRQEWRDTFGSTPFSWADLIAGQYPFEQLRGDDGRIIKAKLNPLVEAGVSLVREYVIAGTIVSCWRQDTEQFGPTWIRGFGHAYSVAGHMAIAGMGSWAKRNNYRGGVKYVIEAGDEGYDELDHLLSFASKVPEIQDLYQWHGHGTDPKTIGSPFHAPDLLAWEWGKYWEETALTQKRPMRMSLVHLLLNRLDRYSFQHLSGPSLLKFFNSIHALGIEQLEEARAEFSQSSTVDVCETLESSDDGDPKNR